MRYVTICVGDDEGLLVANEKGEPEFVAMGSRQPGISLMGPMPFTVIISTIKLTPSPS